MRTHEYEGTGFCTVPIDGVPCLKDRSDEWHVRDYFTDEPEVIKKWPYIVQEFEPSVDDDWWDYEHYTNPLLAMQACDDARRTASPSQQFRVIRLVLGNPEENPL